MDRPGNGPPSRRQARSGRNTEVEQALVLAEDARAEATAAKHERDAALQDLRAARVAAECAEAEAHALRARLAEAEARLASRQTDLSTYAEELKVANEELQAQAEALEETNKALAQTNLGLERRVEERTAEFAEINAMLRAAADTMPHLVWSARPGGAWRYANQRWVEHTGLTPEASAGFGWLEAVHPEDRDRVLEAWRVAIASGELRVEHRLRSRDGAFEWFETRALPLRGRHRDREGETERWFGTSTNIEDVRRAEEALRESEARFRGFAETTDDVVWIVDATTGRLDYVGPAFERIWGLPRAAIMADLGLWAEMLHPEDRAREEGALPRALAGERADIEYRIVRPSDGTVRWIRDVGFPVRNGDGRVRWAAGLARDITAMKEAEARQKLLVAELNHRVKNALATVQSVAAQTARSAETPDDFRSKFQGRLIALARAHDLLTRESWRGASLCEVVRLTVAPHASTEDRPGRVGAEGPEVRLRPEAAIALHMALHELATNAAKYGALSVPGGRVEITWRITREGGADAGPRDGVLELRWRERGGPSVTLPRRSGFGSRLLQQGLPQQVGAEAMLTFAPEGVEFRLDAPLIRCLELA